MFLVVAFYNFISLDDLPRLQADLKSICQKNSIFGTILLAKEGINGTVASTEEGIKALVHFLESNHYFKNDNANIANKAESTSANKKMEFKYSKAMRLPFKKTKVIIKNEIVTLGLPEINPLKNTGHYVAAEAWNDLISEEEVLVIDTRNAFEVELGLFQGAINPETQKFSDFPSFVQNHIIPKIPKKNKKIAMFCTGGIRCEKASAYLIEQGFHEVYQLEGGILKYLEKIPKENSLWNGECFIFDNRIILKKEAIVSREPDAELQE